MLADFPQSPLLTFVSYCLQSASIVSCYRLTFEAICLWSLVAQWVKNLPAVQETVGSTGAWVSIPESGRSPGEGNGKPLQYFCLENPMDRGAWWATYSSWDFKSGHDLATKPQRFSVISNLGLSLVPLHLMILLLLFSQSRLILCNPMDCLTPGFPVLHHLPELVQTHVHWVSDAIQLSHPLSSPSPPAFTVSQHQGLF